MKISESWLRQWVDPDLDTEALAHQLTMLGHEVDGVEVEGAGIADVVIAEVVSADKHPDADKLSVCKVNDGGSELIDVVCGAPNVVAGMKTPFARPGVKLPNGMKLRKAKIRGVVSNGMLCSAVELGLGEESDGIVSLPANAPVGSPLTDFLQLPDTIIDLDLTPNRGDCFSVLGIARDLSALTGASLKDPSVKAVASTTEQEQAVDLVNPEVCPRFAGRVVSEINPNAETPLWMTEQLRRSGLRAISPVVDITNFVMLELGQPLHAYDAAKIRGAISPRLAEAGESLTLLDDKVISLDENTIVIADDSGPIGLAGIMGGLTTAVNDATTEVFFEAAFWPQSFMAGRARFYGLHTDASLRFERGVDPMGQARAVERATELLIEIAGGSAGPLQDYVTEEFTPKRESITLRKDRIARLLGVAIDDQKIATILGDLDMQVSKSEGGWTVCPPSHRFDIHIEADLIEEVARIHGYDAIPVTTAQAAAPLEAVTETRVEIEQVATTLVARDYQEIVSYSFVDVAADKLLSGTESELILSNPISSEMSVMRSTLWSGMIDAAASNIARQQDRVRFFEISKTFHGTLQAPIEVQRIAGLVTGPAHSEQWGLKAENVDFFDIKADVEALLAMSGALSNANFIASEHVALQPGQTAEIRRDNEVIGVVGKLHPSVAKSFSIKRAIYLFELNLEKTLSTTVPCAETVSKFPAIRRDIAVIVDDKVSVGELLKAVADCEPRLIQDVRIFDIYQGERIEAGRKSVAIGLILQETSRTLTDDDADEVLAAAVKILEDQFAAILRD